MRIGQRHGLFDQHVLASGERSQGQWLVQVRGSADVHRFNIGIVDQIFGSFVACGRAEINAPATPIQVPADITEVARELPLA